MFLYFFIQKPLKEKFPYSFLEHSTIKLQKQKRFELNFLFKLSDLNSNFTLTLGYLHPALSNPGQIVTLMWSLEPLAIRLVAVTCNFWQGRGGGQWSEHQSSFLLSMGFATLPRSRSAFSMKEAWSLPMTRELKGTTTGRLSWNLLPFRFLISCKRGHWSCKGREIV